MAGSLSILFEKLIILDTEKFCSFLKSLYSLKGINLSSSDYCVGADLAGEAGEILAITDKGYAKRVLLNNVDKMAKL